MKRFLALLLVLIIGVASAEGMTPLMFLGSRGLMVLDENRLSSMSNDGTGFDDMKEALGGRSLCFYSFDHEHSSESIVFVDDGVLYAAFDMMAMFSSGEDRPQGMIQTFIDLCKAYDFDLYCYQIDNDTICAYGDFESFIASASQYGDTELDMDNINDKTVESKDDFIAAIEAYK